MRCALTVAPAGTTSPVKDSIPRSWISEPPSSNIGSNAPLRTLPKRVSFRPVVPPTGSSWQVAQEASLKMGPSPASIASTSSNSSLPAMNRSDSAAVRLVNGSPCVAEADNVGGSGLVTPGVGDSHAVSQRDSKALRVMRLQ